MQHSKIAAPMRQRKDANCESKEEALNSSWGVGVMGAPGEGNREIPWLHLEG